MSARGEQRARPGRARCQRLSAMLVGLVLAGWSATPCGRALDFQLHITTIEEDGIRKEQFYFQQDAGTQLFIDLPQGWSHVDGPDGFTITPPDINNSLVRIEKSSLTPDTPFKDKGLELYRRRIQADIPQGAVNVQWLEERDNPLDLFNWKDHEFVLTYDFFGQSYQRSVMFLNLNPREQIIVTAVAPKESFKRIHTVAIRMMATWRPAAGGR